MTSSTLKPPQWNEVTAVFGGRFDPPHLGHREAVKGLFKDPGIKQVLILPSATPPHKSTWASAEDRAEMAQLNFKSTGQSPMPSEITIDLREIDRAKLRPDLPSYSYDSILTLRQEIPKLAFVMGSDQLVSFSSWYRFPEILKLCHWIVLERRPVDSGSCQFTLHEWIASGLIQAAHSNLWQIQNSSTFLTLAPTEAPPLSSTGIRESIARTGALPTGSVLGEVSRYLKIKQLYGMRNIE